MSDVDRIALVARLGACCIEVLIICETLGDLDRLARLVEYCRGELSAEEFGQ